MDEERTRYRTPGRDTLREEIGHEIYTDSKDEESVVKMKTRQVASKLKSIDHFIFLYSNEAKYYLPPKENITWEYVRKIISGQKLLLKFNRIESQYQLPRAKGFYIRDIFDSLRDDLEVMKYLPDLGKDANVPREYFLNVILKGLESLKAK